MGFIIMEPADTPPMSGSNSLCVATVLLETGIVPMTEPVTHLELEAPGGLVEATATCRGGKVERVRISNIPSFAERLDATLEVAGIGTRSEEDTSELQSLMSTLYAGICLQTPNKMISIQ